MHLDDIVDNTSTTEATESSTQTTFDPENYWRGLNTLILDVRRELEQERGEIIGYRSQSHFHSLREFLMGNRTLKKRIQATKRSRCYEIKKGSALETTLRTKIRDFFIWQLDGEDPVLKYWSGLNSLVMAEKEMMEKELGIEISYSMQQGNFPALKKFLMKDRYIRRGLKAVKRGTRYKRIKRGSILEKTLRQRIRAYFVSKVGGVSEEDNKFLDFVSKEQTPDFLGYLRSKGLVHLTKEHLTDVVGKEPTIKKINKANARRDFRYVPFTLLSEVLGGAYIVNDANVLPRLGRQINVRYDGTTYRGFLWKYVRERFRNQQKTLRSIKKALSAYEAQQPKKVSV